MISSGERFVDRYLRSRFGNAFVRDLGGDVDVHRWQADSVAPHPTEIAVTLDALRASPELLEMWLEFVVDDAWHAPPAPPGHYLVQAAGVSVRGMTEIEFEEHGQVIRCWIEGEPDERVWRVAVDGVDCGDFQSAEPDGERDRLAMAAVAYLKRHQRLRTPRPL